MAPAALLLAVLLAAPPEKNPPISASGEPDAAPVELPGTRELEHLCAALEPAERLRPKGDAVARAEAEDAHEERRELVTVARYRAVLPAAKVRFGRYERAGRALAISDGVVSLAGGGRLYLATEAGLPVEVDAEVARRILAEQKAGRLSLEVVFDLADETTCSRGRPKALPVEPVTWTWLADGTPLARGGAGADRPVVTAERGARPAVSVGEPLQGPAGTGEELRRHVPALQQCYGEALRRAPGLDGVLVVELAPGRPVPYLAGDSVGDAGLAECVKRALSGVRSADGLAAVPIRFELAPPGP